VNFHQRKSSEVEKTSSDRYAAGVLPVNAGFFPVNGDGETICMGDGKRKRDEVLLCRSEF
jgi:hypothetical protein